MIDKLAPPLIEIEACLLLVTLTTTSRKLCRARRSHLGACGGSSCQQLGFAAVARCIGAGGVDD